MKRASTAESNSNAKRKKADEPQDVNPEDDSPLFQPNQRRKAIDICEQGCDGTGYLEGRVKMKWPFLSGKARISMESPEAGQLSRFEVNFIEASAATLMSAGVHFEVGDMIQLSLKGAEKKLLKHSSSKGLPMELIYRNKLALRFLSRTKPSAPLLSVNTFVDTAPRKQTSPLEEAQQDWFLTQTSARNPVQAVPDKNSDITPDTEPSPSSASPEERETVPSKLAKKAEKKARREAQRAHRQATGAVAQEPIERTPPPQPEQDNDDIYWNEVDIIHVDEPPHVQFPPKPVSVQSQSPAIPQTEITRPSTPQSTRFPSVSRAGTPPPVVHRIQAGHYGQHLGNAPVSVQFEGDDFPGLTLPNGFRYNPLNALLPGNSASVLCNTIGVVVKAEGLQRSTRDFSRKVFLLDPSNWMGDIEGGRSINCFSSTAEANLPDGIQKGDIVLLRQIRAREYFGGVQLLAPSFKRWEWAIVDLQHLRWKEGDSFEHPTRFQPCPEEIQYCIRLNDWWQDIYKQYKEENANVIVHNLADMTGGMSVFARKQGREHRLIQDASPEAPPQGYFDCTVEVLYKHKNHGSHPISLYVTDYTRNEMVAQQQPDWCPPDLTDKVLQIEMWDSSREKAVTMEPGQFYLLRNVRMRRNGGGYLEGKLSEDKITQLDVDELEDQPHLAALLKRKQEYQRAQDEQSGSQFPHKLLEEGEPNKFFRCTVQILGISRKEHCSYAYVTDYTSRPDFAPVYFQKQPDCTVGDDKILKVELRDEQARTAMSLKPGDYVGLRNMRLKLTDLKKEVIGRIAGNERLIHKLNPNDTGNEDFIALLQRKKEWDDMLQAEKAVVENAKAKKSKPKPPPKKAEKPRANDNVASREKSYETLIGRTRTIKEVQEYTRCPWRFYVHGRLSSYWPMSLEDSVVLHCTRCDKTISRRFNDCPNCVEDMSDSAAEPRYQFWLEIKDEEGDTIQVAVNNSENTLLRGLEPADFHDDYEAFEKFHERLVPIIGNLEEVHRVNKRKRLEPDTPWAIFEIASWQISEEERGYAFMNHWLPDGQAEEE